MERGGSLAAQWCLALTTPWTVAHFLLQGIVPTEGLNPGLLYWQADPLLTGASHEFTPSPLPQSPTWATSWKGGRLWVVGGQQCPCALGWSLGGIRGGIRGGPLVRWAPERREGVWAWWHEGNCISFAKYQNESATGIHVFCFIPFLYGHRGQASLGW